MDIDIIAPGEAVTSEAQDMIRNSMSVATGPPVFTRVNIPCNKILSSGLLKIKMMTTTMGMTMMQEVIKKVKEVPGTMRRVPVGCHQQLKWPRLLMNKSREFFDPQG
jgi:hypothetical protein